MEPIGAEFRRPAQSLIRGHPVNSLEQKRCSLLPMLRPGSPTVRFYGSTDALRGQGHLDVTDAKGL